MSEKHDPYLREGEKLYIGRVDSAEIFPGDRRFLIHYWLTDPRVETLKAFWNSRRDSAIISVPAHSPADTLKASINIQEGNHTIQLYSYGNGLRSVVFEKTVSVYGDEYAATLANRSLNRIVFNEADNLLSLYFYEPVNSNETGIRFSYFNTAGETEEVTVPNSLLVSPVNLQDVDPASPVTYSTLYRPEPEAIDTFYAEPVRVSITKTVNVALNKPVSIKPGDMYAANYVASNAVDGLVSNDSRWFSKDDGSEHWIEIDLEQKCNISSFATYIGAGGSFGYPVSQFSFQAWIDGGWLNLVSVTGNTDPQYKAAFLEVLTGKVRYYVPAYPGNPVRMYEIEVYSIMEY
jgi:hypothetical protein